MKKMYILGVLFILFNGLVACSTISARPARSSAKYQGIARVTAYNPHEKDRVRIKQGYRYVWRWVQWGRRTASGIKAIQGITCAAANKFPLYTKVYFPRLKGIIGNGVLEVQDRGEGEKRFHTSDWFDIFCDNKYVMNKIKYGMPEWMEYQILNENRR